MGAHALKHRENWKALKLSEIMGSMTEFDLYLDLGEEVVLCTAGPHHWSRAETEELLRNGQFVVLYDQADTDRVQLHLHLHPSALGSEIFDGSEPLLIDGISEFVKTIYSARFQHDYFVLIRNLSLAFSGYLQAYSELGNLCLLLARHDAYSFYHNARVAGYSVALSLVVQGPERTRLWDLLRGAFLHDLGNLEVPSEILNRIGPLDPADWPFIHQHPEAALKLLADVPLPALVRDIIFQHHERIDGGGYPRRLPGRMLSTEIRIVSIIDVYFALTVPRPYQIARSPKVAVEFMEAHLGSFFDPKILKELRTLLGIDATDSSQDAA